MTVPTRRPRQRVVDAHLHLWSLRRGQGDSPYAWITPELGPLHRDITPEEAYGQMARAGVDEAVLVQADDTPEDTEAMLAVARTRDWVAGVVGWLPLDDPASTGDTLSRWQDEGLVTARPGATTSGDRPAGLVVGIRHLVHTDPRRDYLLLPEVLESLGLVASAGLALDVPDAFPDHLTQVDAVATAVPTLRLVVDHLGKPPLGEGTGSTAYRAWERQLREAAAHPLVHAKVSGLHLPGADYDLTALEPVLDVALDAFGPERLMLGSDWPMNLPHGGYGPALEPLRAWATGLGAAAADRVLSGTATECYRLGGGEDG